MNVQYIAQRLLTAIVVLLGVTFAVFLIIQLVPGDPARVILGVQANEEDLAALRERLGLNDPFLVQYGNWLKNAVQGDLGKSLITRQEVTPQIMNRLPATLQLAAAALLGDTRDGSGSCASRSIRLSSLPRVRWSTR